MVIKRIKRETFLPNRDTLLGLEELSESDTPVAMPGFVSWLVWGGDGRCE